MNNISEFEIIVNRGREWISIDCDTNEKLLDALVRHKLYLSAVCGGKGRCGKCMIQVLEGDLDITDADRKYISEAQLAKGYRLACCAYPKEKITISLEVSEEADFKVVGAMIDRETAEDKSNEDLEDDEYGIGIDIGTTTLALSLIGINSGKIICNYTGVNRQRAYGADVVSRMMASIEGKGDMLRDTIIHDLYHGIRNLIHTSGIPKERLSKIVISANTTMLHLLMGYSCETLGVYPFTPVNIDTIKVSFNELFSSDFLTSQVIILPGISTYVGADLVAGLLVCDFDRQKSPLLLIDLGTNGEMAIGNQDGIWVCSTAAGPAFEGGNISWGVGSINGAISNVTINNDIASYRTIGDKEPIGLCGTGVIEVASELLKEGLIDETGLLEEKYLDGGYPIAVDQKGQTIVFTQKDVREIQLAKSAIRAGIETLMKRSDISYDQIETVYLAGGFGFNVDIDKTIRLGLIAEEFRGKIKTIGNSSLAGAIKYMVDKDAEKRANNIISKSKEIQLSNDLDFNEFYINYMFFE
ncbi:MAG: DUF4445 domain-containing protein [Clostridiales bacterium]|nr:DUF4445 domain-containing protein [Clostridiales bacterium]